MNLKWIFSLLISVAFISCKSDTDQAPSEEEIENFEPNLAEEDSGSLIIDHSEGDSNTQSNYTPDNPKYFIPSGYVEFERTEGDLNKDGVKDMVLIIKNTLADKWEENSSGEKVDRNRRGIIVLFKNGNNYELASKNYSCFSSENEEGGVYFAPELDVYTQKGNLYIHYAHGRYGYWTYTFRYQNNDFELIGFDSSNNRGPVIESFYSANFSTKKMLVKTNTNWDAEGGDEVFEEKWVKMPNNPLFRLSEIYDFDELDLKLPL